MKSSPTFSRVLLATGLCFVVGCFSPRTVAPRQFVLAPAPPTDAPPVTNVRLGVRVVGMPEYLRGRSLAVRQSANEIRYLETALWAESLDHGFERVLAADLAAMIPTEQVRRGAWRTDDVTLEVHIRVEQFDVDKDGKGNLVAEWRITFPGGGKTLKSATARLAKPGKPLAGDAQNLVTTLSELTTEFSRTLARAVKDIQPQ